MTDQLGEPPPVSVAVRQWQSPPVVAAVVVAILVATATRYGWHRDELYFVEAGRHPAWGYADQPPLVPILARLLDAAGGGSLFVLRLAPALATGGVVALSARIAGALGGDQRTRVLAALAVALAPATLTFGHLLSTATVDVVVWLVVLYAVATRVQGGPGWWWLVAGAAGGVGMYAKQTVALLAVALAVGFVAAGRQHLQDRWLWAGIAVGVVLPIPTVAWQAANGWPQAEMASSLRAEHGGLDGMALSVVLLVLVVNPVLVPTVVRGLRWLWASPRLRPLALTVVVAVVAALASGGQFYYSAPALLFALTAGTVARWGRATPDVVVDPAAQPPRRPRRVFIPAAVVALALLPLAVPILPLQVADDLGLGDVNETLAEQHGWDEVVAATAIAWTAAPASDSAPVVLAGNYGEAAALRRWGPDRGIPAAAVHSGHNAFGWWGPPADDAGRTVVLVGRGQDAVSAWCDAWTERARVDIAVLPGEEDGVVVATCRRRMPWSVVWPGVSHLD